MLSKELNNLLTLTGPDQTMGQFMRRYWLPALLTEEIPTPDAPPVQVRLLGEELVAFRDSEGRVGLLAEHCLHRGTSLFYGRNEACGLRCIYHGWKYDVTGQVVDTPAEPMESDFKTRLRQTAYPVQEAAGVIWAYLGPPEKLPLFPEYEWTQVPLENTYVNKSLLECNYLQGLEGECDSSHLSFLHKMFNTGGRHVLYGDDTAPAYETEETDFGVRLLASRRTADGRTYFRVSSFVVPLSVWVPPGRCEIHMYMPIDDTHTWRYDLGFLRDRPATPEDNHRKLSMAPGYRRLRTMANHYLQDRELQRTSDFTGIEDYLNEDACATETMGPIFDRTKERLGLSDKGVLAVRRYLIETLQAFQGGAEPPHILTEHGGRLSMRHITSLAEIVPTVDDWHTLYPHLTQAAQPADARGSMVYEPVGVPA